MPEQHLHPLFKLLRSTASEAEKKTLASWTEGFRDRDGKFVKEFQTTFDSSFWEIYVYALLRSVGLAPDMQHSAPDFCVNGALSIEAVVALHPDGAPPHWATVGLPVEIPVDEVSALDLATQRLAQAISSKRKMWEERYAKLPHACGLPFVIAVSPFEQTKLAFQGTRALSRVLWDEHLPVSVLAPDGAERVVGRAPAAPVFKKSGASVPLAVFSRPEYSCISGVLFNSLATWSKVHAMSGPTADPCVYHQTGVECGKFITWTAQQETVTESLADGAHLYLNPNADHPVDPEPWQNAGVCVHELHSNEVLSHYPERLLITRVARRFSSKGIPAELRQPSQQPFAPFQRSYPHDGVEFGGPALLGSASVVDLRLHRGWTITVGRDEDDWLVMAKRGQHLSVHEFVAAGDEDMYLGPCFASKEAAVAAGRVAVDATFKSSL